MDKEEMDAIMQERIEKFNNYVMAQDIDKMPVGLFNGKMGICIYFYLQARLTQNNEYEKYAEKLLESVFAQLSTKSIISLEDGLIGVCLGLNYLIEKGFQTGNINHVLSELDDKIYQTAWFDLMKNYSSSLDSLKSVFEVALYFSLRLQNLKLNTDNRFLYEAIVIKAINYLDNTLSYHENFFEPLTYSLNEYFLSNYFFLLSIVYKHGFYNYKIEKIIDEIYPKLCSTYPLLQSNRMQLISGIECLNNEMRRNSIYQYINRLKLEIDYEKMINLEFRNRNLLLANGICGMYLIQSVLFKNNMIPKSLISNKIIKSELWADSYKDNVKQHSTIGLFTGFGGIILIYQHIVKTSLE